MTTKTIQHKVMTKTLIKKLHKATHLNKIKTYKKQFLKIIVKNIQIVLFIIIITILKKKNHIKTNQLVIEIILIRKMI